MTLKLLESVEISHAPADFFYFVNQCNQGELLDALSVKGKEYYISNINNKAHYSFKSMYTVHTIYIQNLMYLVVLNDVN